MFKGQHTSEGLNVVRRRENGFLFFGVDHGVFFDAFAYAFACAFVYAFVMQVK